MRNRHGLRAYHPRVLAPSHAVRSGSGFSAPRLAPVRRSKSVPSPGGRLSPRPLRPTGHSRIACKGRLALLVVNPPSIRDCGRLGGRRAGRPIFPMIFPIHTFQPRLRILGPGDTKFGPGKAELLRRIGETGSIRSAAAQMSMSYNRAWTLVREMNRQFRTPLIQAVRGGPAGGGARVTTSGEKVLSRYSRMERACRAAVHSDWRALRRFLR